jgi:hypothetical protein
MGLPPHPGRGDQPGPPRGAELAATPCGVYSAGRRWDTGVTEGTSYTGSPSWRRPRRSTSCPVPSRRSVDRHDDRPKRSPRLRAADNRPEPRAARPSLACAIGAVALASGRPNTIGLEGVLRAGRAMPTLRIAQCNRPGQHDPATGRYVGWDTASAVSQLSPEIPVTDGACSERRADAGWTAKWPSSGWGGSAPA